MSYVISLLRKCHKTSLVRHLYFIYSWWIWNILKPFSDKTNIWINHTKYHFIGTINIGFYLNSSTSRKINFYEYGKNPTMINANFDEIYKSDMILINYLQYPLKKTDVILRNLFVSKILRWMSNSCGISDEKRSYFTPNLKVGNSTSKFECPTFSGSRKFMAVKKSIKKRCPDLLGSKK